MPEESREITHMICPEGHAVPYERWNYAKDSSDNFHDADGVPMYENGLYCHSCDRAYGLSKLKDPENLTSSEPS